MRPRSPNPKRNAVAVRFDDAAFADVDGAAKKDGALVSPWVRDAAVEKARGEPCKRCQNCRHRGKATG